MELATTTSTNIARPLRVLVPLIKEDLVQADDAATKAGMPYFLSAGEKLLEARGQLPDRDFRSWTQRNFTVKFKQLSLYMDLAERTRGRDKPFASLQEFRRVDKGYKQTVHPQPWHEPVKAAMGKVNVAALKQAALAQQAERALQRTLALSLIDIGFKALATKLHPDKKGGSREAMTRLNHVRKLLQAAVTS